MIKINTPTWKNFPICGKNGIVRQVTQIEPDQKSKIYDPVGTYFTISLIPLLGTLIILLSL